MKKISMLLPVHNEGLLLRYSLEHPIKHIDEIIIVDGGPDGPSTDSTKTIVDAYDKLYPNKIKYYQGIFRMANGSWDESAHRNYGLSKVTGDILMPHCGDMIYTEPDILKIIESINKFPDKRIIYCPFVEFWLDQTKIRLYGGHAMEAWFPVLAISDIPFVSMELVCHYSDGPNLKIKEHIHDDFMFIPNVFRYHYGWISGFSGQVKKHIRNMTMGAWGESGKEIILSGDAGIAKWAINHVLSYPDLPCGFVYTGNAPINTSVSYSDGCKEVIDNYKTIYGENFLNE